MTTTTDTTSTDEPARVLSVRTLRTYAADWALFTDRCHRHHRAPGRPAGGRRLLARTAADTQHDLPAAGVERGGDHLAGAAAARRQRCLLYTSPSPRDG